MWNPRTCECQCDMWCKPGQYLDSICKNKLASRIVRQCTSVINENNGDDIDNTITYVFIGLFIVIFIGIICSCIFTYFKWFKSKKKFKKHINY